MCGSGSKVRRLKRKMDNHVEKSLEDYGKLAVSSGFPRGSQYGNKIFWNRVCGHVILRLVRE